MIVNVYKMYLEAFTVKCKELHISIADVKVHDSNSVDLDLNEAVDVMAFYELGSWYAFRISEEN